MYVISQELNHKVLLREQSKLRITTISRINEQKQKKYYQSPELCLQILYVHTLSVSEVFEQVFDHEHLCTRSLN